MQLRTSTLLAPILLAAAVLAAGCGSDNSEPSAPTTAPASPATTAASAFPVSIPHKFGTTEIPEAPQRVVSVGFTDQDTVLALGVAPVGIRDWYGDQPYAVWPWAKDALGSATPEVLSSGDLNFEAIAALKPDLIVGLSSGMKAEEYQRLAAIAPTLAQSDKYVEYGEPWQEITMVIGQALGKSAEAGALVGKVEADLAAARAAHPEFTGASGVVGYAYNNGTVGGYTSQDSRGRMLADLGFVTPAAVEQRAGDKFYADFSAEEMSVLDTDVVVWVALGPELAALQASPIRQQLRAAKEGREVFLDQIDGGAMGFSSVLSLPYALDHLVPKLAAAVDGNPATT